MTDLEQTAFDFIRRSRGCDDRKELLADLSAVLTHFGLDHFTISRMPQPGDQMTSSVLVSTYSRPWIEHYNARRFVLCDPVIRHMRTAETPKIWDDIPAQKGSDAWKVMQEARAFDVQGGVSIPIVTGRGLRAQVSLASSHGDWRRDAVPSLHLVGIYAHYCLQSIADIEERRGQISPTLTSRERECLRWTAAGKSHWDTGVIMSISEHTVIFHLRNVARKFNCRTVSAQIVAEGFRHNLID